MHFSSSICSLCSGRESDSAGHILFQCEVLRDIREYWWNKVIESMPPAMVSSISAMDQREKLCFILSGLKCERIVPAWSDVMVNMSKFVYYIYQCRKKKYESMEAATQASTGLPNAV